MPLNRSGPIFHVRVGNKGSQSKDRLPVDVRVKSLEFDEDEAKQDVLSLTIDNHDLANFDNPLFAVGNVVEATWGYEGAMGPTRECSITAVKGFQQLKVECKGKSHIQNLIQKSRSFENVTRADVARQIAAEHGAGQFGLEVIVDDTEVRFDKILQVRETDAQFLRRLAMKEGFDYYEDQAGFHFHARRVGQSPVRRFTYQVDQAGGDIESMSVDGDITAKPALIVAAGRDPLAKENFAPHASDSTDPGHATNAAVPLVTVSKVGAVDLASLAKARADAASSGTHTMATTATTKKDAKAQAGAAQSRSKQKALKVTLQCVGDATIRAKQTVELRGCGRTLSGNYHVSNVKHHLGPGYKMTLVLTRDGVGSQTGMGANDPSTNGKVNAQGGPAETSQKPFVAVAANGAVGFKTGQK